MAVTLAILLPAVTQAYEEDPLARGFAFFQDGDLDAARRFFMRLVEQDSDNWEASYWLARIHWEEGEFEAAEQRLVQAIQGPPRAEHYLWLGRTYRQQLQSSGLFRVRGLAKKSVAAYEKALQLDPMNLDALEDLATLLLTLPRLAGGAKKRGVDLIEELESRSPERGRTLRGRYHMQNEEYELAAEQFGLALESGPGHIEARYLLGRALARQGLHGSAIEAFEAVIARGVPQATAPGTDDADWYVEAHYQVGRSAALSGLRLELGLRRLKRHLELIDHSGDPTGAAAALYYVGQIEERRGNLDAARQAYDESLRWAPDYKRARKARERLGE